MNANQYSPKEIVKFNFTPDNRVRLYLGTAYEITIRDISIWEVLTILKDIVKADYRLLYVHKGNEIILVCNVQLNAFYDGILLLESYDDLDITDLEMYLNRINK